MIRLLVMCVAVVTFWGSVCFAQGPEALLNTLSTLQTRLCQAFMDQDLPTIQRLVAKDAVVAEEGRLFTTADEGMKFHVDNVKVTGFKLTDFKVIKFTDDVVALYMRADTEATRGGMRLAPVNYVTTIWARQGGDWKAVYSTSHSPSGYYK